MLSVNRVTEALGRRPSVNEDLDELAIAKIEEWKKFHADWKRWMYGKAKYIEQNGEMAWHMSEPNEPNYFRANND